MHAAIIAINEAIDQQVALDTFTALQNKSAMLINLDNSIMQEYQDMLYSAKQIKSENTRNKVCIHLFLSPSTPHPNQPPAKATCVSDLPKL